MKRIISVILTLTMLMTVSTAFASASGEAVLRVQALGIMQGDENGMRLEDNITRAEFAAIICRLAGIPEPNGMNTIFSDVGEDHWAKDYVAAAVSLGIINGMGDGTYAPSQNVTYPQALKMFVCLLGYASIAEEKGGWPNGYTAQAGSLGLTDGADISADAAIRGEIITIIDNVLDTKPLMPVYGSSDAYKIDDSTIAEKLERNSDAEKFEGIFTENAYKSVVRETPVAEDGYITVDGKEYRSSEDYSELVGYYVYGWVRENSYGKQEVVCMEADENMNTTLTVDAEDAVIKDDYVEYYDENDKLKKFNISSIADYVYNGRYTKNRREYISNDTGKFTFIDNDGDKKADIVEIIDSESFVIEKINTSNSSVYFADDMLFRGRRGFELSSDDEDKKVKIADKDGNAITFDSIEIGDAITLSVSEDLNLVTAIISKDTVIGTVDGIVGDDKITIAGNEYKTALNLRLGQEAEFILDSNGVVIGISGVEKLDLKYGYIANATMGDNMDSTLRLLIIEGLAPEKEVKVKDGTETVSYYLQNDAEKEYVCNTKIKYSLDRVDGVTSSVDSSSINPDSLVGCVAGYALDADGKIRTLCVYSISESLYNDCEFNADIFAFGGESVGRGYSTDENTQVIAIPKSSTASISDYAVRVRITDGTQYSAYGVTGRSEYDINDNYEKEKYNREPVDIVLVRADMDSSKPYPIQEDATICIVGESVGFIDENGEHVRKVEVLKGDEVVELITDVDGNANQVAATLRMGDLIQYVIGSNGKVENIKKLASIQGLKNHMSSSGNLYGLAYDISYASYDYMSNEMADFIEMAFDNADNLEIRFFNDGEQVIYLYNRARGYIEAATTDDIITLQQSGGNPSKLFVYRKNNDAQAIVIIND